MVVRGVEKMLLVVAIVIGVLGLVAITLDDAGRQGAGSPKLVTTSCQEK